MLETIVIIAIVLALVIAVVLILAATKPAESRGACSAVVAAPPEKIFSLIDDFHQWRAWSPWEDRDPALKRSYEGAPRGRGAGYAWGRNPKGGARRRGN